MTIALKNDNFLHITHPKFNAIVSLQGAQLLQWKPKDTDDILWSTDFSHFSVGKAFRGGVPVCWPWFGKVQKPSHGFARLMKWTLEKTQHTKVSALFIFTLQDTPQTQEIFPYSFKLTLQMTLGLECKIELFIETEVPTTGALHSYFRTYNILDEHIDGLGLVYTDALEAHTQKRQNGTLIMDKEVDRVYTNAKNVTIVSNSMRKLKLQHNGQSDLVVWNPWEKTSLKMTDMKKNDYLKMFCVETAKINTMLQPKDYLGVTINIVYENSKNP